MIRLTKYLEKILYKEFKEGDRKHEVIASAFVEAVFTGKIELGITLPTQSFFIDFYGVSHLVIEAAWKMMKEEYKIIVTNKSGGTNIVEKLPGKKLNGSVKVQERDYQRTMLNRHIIPEKDLYAGSFSSDLIKSYRKFRDLTDDEINKKILPELVSYFRSEINFKLGTSYTEKDVCYFGDYHYAISSICRTYLTAEEVFIIISPAPDQIKEVIIEAKKEVLVLPSNSSDVPIAEIERICNEKSTGIVYVASGPGSKTKELISAEKMEQLISLQKSYGFAIIFDDRYPELDGAGNLSSVDISGYDSVFYLSPVGRRNLMVYNIILIAANKKALAKIKPQLNRMSHLMEIQTAYVLLDLARQRNLLFAHEVKAYKDLKSAYQITVSELLKTGLWKQEGFSFSGNGFIYLEPISGKFLPDVFKELQKNHIYVFNPSRFVSDIPNNNRIYISIPTDKSEKQLVQIMQKLHNILITMIG
ncbi:aminotransferase class I/II-fold pyridoxal phosphate-dependent enzyme [Pedobacter sp. L105]|uniref:aminotransferase class I/II-fold pyridoxal phosphate-dependent enzyme n=1 Tax=Pedobacter sp. L105 TaxID=1641871 RepID=UPI00131D26F6|nr:aminotransferase class I/II-fold pyridoxal phosphate-dependent enzyme [Pedobacter sp. L105]